MNKVSVIIPARNEKYLSQTVDDIFTKAAGDIEVIVVVDGSTKYPLPRPRTGLKLIYNPQYKGLRSAINTAVAAATGKYLLKIDAHCALAKNFDEVLKKDFEDDWVVVPRIYGLDVKKWKRAPGRGPFDYFFLSCPWKNIKYPSYFSMKDCGWSARDKSRKKILIDDLMTFSGCCCFMSTNHFRNRIKGLNTTDFGYYAENQEIALKTWLGGGRVVINKKTWCAHFEQHEEDRGFDLAKNEIFNSQKKVARYWVNNRWEGQIHNFSWLIEKFWPLPTKQDPKRTQSYYWPDNWRDYLSDMDDTTMLAQLALKYGSDKCPQIHHFYTEYYTKLLKGKRQDIKKVLEIGVGYPETMQHSPNYQIGASLYMWQDYFPNALIYGIDILPDLVFKKGRIETFLCDQTDKAALINLINNIGTDIDLVIDDGSHIPEDQVFTCLTLMPLLKEDVIYIIEDVRFKHIANFLKGYNVEVIRKSKMASIYDRLIKVTNK